MRIPVRNKNKLPQNQDWDAQARQSTCAALDAEKLDSCNSSLRGDLEQLQLDFEEAASSLERAIGSHTIEQDDLLLLYGLYKQATCGPCTSFRPPFFDLKGRSKWVAWKNLEDMPQEEAKAAYVKLVSKLMGSESKGSGTLGGPVVSTLAEDPLEDDIDVPEWDSLHIRASQGDVEGVQRLLQAGAELNSRDSEGCTALHWASDRGSLEVVQLLVKRGADVGFCDLDGQSPKQYAAMSGHTKVVEYFDGLKVG